MVMSQIFRSFSSNSQISAAEAAQEVLHRFGSKPISARKQLIDPNQVRLLSLTLGRDSLHKGSPSLSEEVPRNGTPIPPGYHLAYFTPAILKDHLGPDGSDQTVNPLPPFTRRMWAGGELKWSKNPEQLLRVGQEVEEVTTIVSAEPKKLKTGVEMILVGVEKQFNAPAGLALTDRRSWVFQKAITEPQSPPPKPRDKPFPEGELRREFVQSEETLFRFSALTFNGHKIHYSRKWCRDVEGHRDCVVHGPLNLINMLDFWRDNRGGDSEIVPMSIAYRALSPLYTGEKYCMLLSKNLDANNNSVWEEEVWDRFGKLAMKGTIVD
ncbi:hypothetical protein GQ43DRAFT_435831 [Delitschia confertaspora ATCC 74209]|uniref:N-terminal of MaoC-like dehydratase domain-containing protein n=1 Tax=Delitschia confertaspora ATCC 74209 TaxID=1513339 RepID=A0A9P4JE59_9PLEO|nr:hypothetical protein GQ43DRAFT_435831 [Delitschia confertaspora ATCC 74209]